MLWVLSLEDGHTILRNVRRGNNWSRWHLIKLQSVICSAGLGWAPWSEETAGESSDTLQPGDLIDVCAALQAVSSSRESHLEDVSTKTGAPSSNLLRDNVCARTSLSWTPLRGLVIPTVQYLCYHMYVHIRSLSHSKQQNCNFRSSRNAEDHPHCLADKPPSSLQSLVTTLCLPPILLSFIPLDLFTALLTVRLYAGARNRTTTSVVERIITS